MSDGFEPSLPNVINSGKKEQCPSNNGLHTGKKALHSGGAELHTGKKVLHSGGMELHTGKKVLYSGGMMMGSAVLYPFPWRLDGWVDSLNCCLHPLKRLVDLPYNNYQEPIGSLPMKNGIAINKRDHKYIAVSL